MSTNTRDVLAGPVLALLAAEWPQFDWRSPRLVHGAFHVVAILGATVVVRVNFGAGHRQRCIDESQNARAVTALSLPLEVPRVLCGPFHAPDWSAVALHAVSGTVRQAIPWAEAREPLLKTLEVFAAADYPDGGAPLGRVRHWCGGDDWPDIVGECVAGFIAEHRRLAASLVNHVVTLEPVSRPTFVHGDFGVHNLMFTGSQVTGMFDVDASAFGDPAIDIAPLLGVYPLAEMARDFSRETLERAQVNRATLPLQVAAAASLSGDSRLEQHALANFSRRVEGGTLHRIP